MHVYSYLIKRIIQRNILNVKSILLDIIENTMYFYQDNQNFVWTSINCSIGQLTETRTAIIFARQLARDGSIIKRSLFLPYAALRTL